MPISEREKATAIVVTSMVIVILGIIGITRRGLVDPMTLADHKDALSSLQSIVTIFALITASIVSYYRFFRGRTFSVRAEPALSCIVLPFNDQSYLHSVTFSVKNVGTMSIWDPKPHVRVELEGLEEGGSYVITNWLDEAPVGQERDKCVIDPGETATFVMRHTFDKTIPAVTYIASMTSEKKDSWTIGASFANALNEK